MATLTKRSNIVYKTLKKLAINGAVKISNAELAYELFKKEKFTGQSGNVVEDSSISKFLKKLTDLKLIHIEPGNTTRDRIIYIRVIKD